MPTSVFLKGTLRNKERDIFYVSFLLRDGFHLTIPFHEDGLGNCFYLNNREVFAKGTVDEFTQPYITIRLPNNILEARTTDIFYNELLTNPVKFTPLNEVKTVPAPQIETPTEILLYGEYENGKFKVQGHQGPVEFDLNIYPMKTKDGRWVVHTFGSFNEDRKTWTVRYLGAIFETESDYVEPIKIDKAIVSGNVVEFHEPVEAKAGETIQVNYKVDEHGQMTNAKAKNLTQNPDPDCPEEEASDSKRVEKAPADTDRVKYESGAQRSADVEEYRYDLFHPIFMKRVAKVWAVGAQRYGVQNWELGFPMWTLFNHLLGHLWDYLGGDRSEDHLAHMACNVVMLVTEDEMRYDSNRDYLRLPGSQLSPETRELIKNHQEEIKRKKEEKKPVNIHKRLLTLYQMGTIRYSPGSTVNFRQFARAHFNDCSFGRLRSELNVDGDENILNLDWHQDNNDIERNIVNCSGAITKAVQNGKLQIGSGSMLISELQADVLNGRWDNEIVLASLKEANFRIIGNQVHGLSEKQK